ncbi:hypothetical protein RhiXN_11528 [Rhizoctonia solani]|uniref:Uncharacterized protein n=1 Tax=Rhizoctonia solani TaxID=456999 RepID=A0A8H8P2R3_9AGAM|nr:uncharacterized protein RhiXN_11528 [Rhizoctonia solani]QRW24616.1 hypothetical protein RhiXN_11528 [Rhizoctonia solani]
MLSPSTAAPPMMMFARFRRDDAGDILPPLPGTEVGPDHSLWEPRRRNRWCYAWRRSRPIPNAPGTGSGSGESGNRSATVWGQQASKACHCTNAKSGSLLLYEEGGRGVGGRRGFAVYSQDPCLDRVSTTTELLDRARSARSMIANLDPEADASSLTAPVPVPNFVRMRVDDACARTSFGFVCGGDRGVISRQRHRTCTRPSRNSLVRRSKRLVRVRAKTARPARRLILGSQIPLCKGSKNVPRRHPARPVGEIVSAHSNPIRPGSSSINSGSR